MVERTNNEQKGELEQLTRLDRLIDRYAQSRTLGLWIPLSLMFFNVVLMLTVFKVVGTYGVRMGRLWLVEAIVWLTVLWVSFSSTWLVCKLVKRYGYSFYEKEGQIELERERVPIWAWVAYLITFLGPAFLSAFRIMPVRWALAIALASFGAFLLYLSKKHKERPLGVVYGTLCLVMAIATAAGVVRPLGGADWGHSLFVSLMVYIIVAGVVTIVVVHIYNRKVLHKIKEMRPFGGQQADKSDS